MLFLEAGNNGLAYLPSISLNEVGQHLRQSGQQQESRTNMTMYSIKVNEQLHGQKHPGAQGGPMPLIFGDIQDLFEVGYVIHLWFNRLCVYRLVSGNNTSLKPQRLIYAKSTASVLAHRRSFHSSFTPSPSSTELSSVSSFQFPPCYSLMYSRSLSSPVSSSSPLAVGYGFLTKRLWSLQQYPSFTWEFPRSIKAFPHLTHFLAIGLGCPSQVRCELMCLSIPTASIGY